MHDLGINHTDLNIHNILMDEQEKFWIIDFDKCFQQSGESWKQGNLERLKRSFEKEAQRSLGEDIIESMEPIIVGYREHDK